MRVRVLVQPTGLLNGVPVPEPGELFEVEDDQAAEFMIAAGWFERVEKPKAKASSQAKAEKQD